MSKKILVVDDEPLILIAVDRALSKLGYNIVKAQNMKELDSALRDSPFDLLLTDIYMEDGTADTIIQQVRKLSPEVKIMKMSGSVEKHKSHDFIEKPFRIEELRRKVHAILDESP